MATPTINKNHTLLGTDYCLESWQQLGKDIMDNTVLSLSGDFTLLNIAATAPTDEADKLYPWLNTSDGRIYIYQSGAWLSRNPISALSSERRLWVGTTVELLTYDGGSNEAVSDTTGPMWEVDTAFAGLFPVGVGAFSASGNIAVKGSTTDTGATGEDKHTLTTAEMPDHNHTFDIHQGAGENNDNFIFACDESTVQTQIATSNVGNNTPHNNLPPMYGVYFIKRTARVYYKSS